MKKITIELPDDVTVVAATYIGSTSMKIWISNGAFAPQDGLTVVVPDLGKDKTGKILYVPPKEGEP